MRKLFCVALLVLTHAPCFAQSYACASLKDPVIKALSEKLHPKAELDDAACAVMPDDKDKTIVVLDFAAACDAKDKDQQCRDVDIAVVRSNTGEVVAHLFQKGAWTEEAAGPPHATVDTGRYMLSPQVRAFGVRVTNTGGTHYDSALTEAVLSLYELQGNTIVPRLIGLPIYESGRQFDRDESRAPDACTPESRFSTETTIAIASTTTNGYADLQATTIERKSATTQVKGAPKKCQTTTEPEVKKHYTMRFDGKVYALPKTQ